MAERRVTFLTDDQDHPGQVLRGPVSNPDPKSKCPGVLDGYSQYPVPAERPMLVHRGFWKGRRNRRGSLESQMTDENPNNSETRSVEFSAVQIGPMTSSAGGAGSLFNAPVPPPLPPPPPLGRLQLTPIPRPADNFEWRTASRRDQHTDIGNGPVGSSEAVAAWMLRGGNRSVVVRDPDAILTGFMGLPSTPNAAQIPGTAEGNSGSRSRPDTPVRRRIRNRNRGTSFYVALTQSGIDSALRSTSTSETEQSYRFPVLENGRNMEMISFGPRHAENAANIINAGTTTSPSNTALSTTATSPRTASQSSNTPARSRRILDWASSVISPGTNAIRRNSSRSLPSNFLTRRIPEAAMAINSDGPRLSDVLGSGIEDVDDAAEVSSGAALFERQGSSSTTRNRSRSRSREPLS